MLDISINYKPDRDAWCHLTDNVILTYWQLVLSGVFKSLSEQHMIKFRMLRDKIKLAID